MGFGQKMGRVEPFWQGLESGIGLIILVLGPRCGLICYAFHKSTLAINLIKNNIYTDLMYNINLLVRRWVLARDSLATDS
jgi:hypothetical protein